jgi:peptidoglycan/LPS O-acetylase OafA/YrhL
MTTISSTNALPHSATSGQIAASARATRASDDLPNLDFLRAVAVLLVVFGHLTFFRGITAVGPFNLYEMGGLGVRLFFVHTCFVLMLSLQRQWKKQGGLRLFAEFMIRRIFRIYPLSVTTVLLVLMFRPPMAELQPWHFLGTTPRWTTILSNLLLVQRIGPGQTPSILGPMWSLPYEMAMYPLLPWLFLFLYSERSIGRVAAVWLVSIASALALLLYPPHAANNVFLLFIPCFLPGVIAYQLQRVKRPKLPAILWMTLVLVIPMLYLHRYNPNFSMEGWIKSWLVCLALGLGIPFFTQISVRWIAMPSYLIAKYSYGIYLTHFFSIWFAFEYLRNALPLVARLAVFLVLAAGLPVFFYHLLEEPMVQLGKRVGKRFETALAI